MAVLTTSLSPPVDGNYNAVVCFEDDQGRKLEAENTRVLNPYNIIISVPGKKLGKYQVPAVGMGNFRELKDNVN